MSYILESLKKSDQERQLAQPGVGTTNNNIPDGYLVITNSSEATSSWSFRSFILFLLFFVISAILVYFYVSPTLTHSEDKRFSNESSQSFSTDTTGDVPQAPNINSQEIKAAVTTSPTTGNATNNRKEPVNDSLLVINEALSVVDEKKSNTKSVGDAFSLATPSVVDSLYDETAEEESVSINSLYEKTNNIEPEKNSELIPAQKEPVEDARPDAVSSIFSLDRQLQQQIPAISYDAHIYASDNKSGFVILDGAKRRVGEKMSNGVYIEGIDEDFVLLSFQGVIFSLPAMRSWKP